MTDSEAIRRMTDSEVIRQTAVNTEVPPKECRHIGTVMTVSEEKTKGTLTGGNEINGDETNEDRTDATYFDNGRCHGYGGDARR